MVEHNLWLGKNIQKAIDSHRLHHQLLPPEAKYEEGFEKVCTLLSGISYEPSLKLMKSMIKIDPQYSHYFVN